MIHYSGALLLDSTDFMRMDNFGQFSKQNNNNFLGIFYC